MNPPEPTIEYGFKQRDAASYDACADSYDRHISRLASPLARHICFLAKLRSGDRSSTWVAVVVWQRGKRLDAFVHPVLC